MASGRVIRQCGSTTCQTGIIPGRKSVLAQQRRLSVFVTFVNEVLGFQTGERVFFSQLADSVDGLANRISPPAPISCWASISSTYISSDRPRACASAANRSGRFILTCIKAILACVLKQWRAVSVECAVMPKRVSANFARFECTNRTHILVPEVRFRDIPAC